MSRHLKREVAPVFWPIPRKRKVWAVKPIPGPHAIEGSFPLLVLVRDVLGLAKTYREAKKIIKGGGVIVDGKVRREEKFPVGLMDVVEFPALEKAYRIVPSSKGLTVHGIPKDEARFKLCRIENKITVKRGRMQLNLHDGRNILVEAVPKKKAKVYKTLDVLKISIPEQEILDHVKMDVGVLAVITGGRNVGRTGKVEKIECEKRPYPALVTLKDSEGRKFQTISEYVFPIGIENPLISMPKE